MLNCVWPAIILISIFSAVVTNRIPELSNSVLSGAKDAVDLTISIMGMMCFWTGIMKIAEKSNLTQKISKIFERFINFIFPECDPKSSASQAICMNITANLLGLGNAATPLGIKAMQELQKTNKSKSSASNSMIMLAVINTASFQIIPTMLCALRQKHGSENPMNIVPFLWITSLCSLTVGIIAAKTFESKRDD
ncbi:MAG: nucleoside recognition domain-containing protein [Clostridia bacterium]|nr:nucleoside recognition domain-containing protein [Clostridia bacterium]